MEIRIVLDDKDAGLLLRVLDEGATLHTKMRRHHETPDYRRDEIHRR